MRRIFFVASVLSYLLVSQASVAQDNNTWSLQRAVQYALDHNISIQQSVLNERLAKLTLQQSRLSQIPNINGSGSYGRSFGRSVDPTTNQFVNGNSYDFLSISGSADVLLFGWFQRRNNITRNRYNLEATKADLDQLRDDVSLNVATGYLRALLAKEQIRVSEKQVELSRAQLDQTLKFADAGRVPELNVAQLQSQLANDSANLISAISEYTASILDMKALLNFELATPFELEVPAVELADQVAFSALTPEQVYEEAARHFGSIRSSQLRLQAANRGLWASKGALLPQLSAGAQIGSNWASTYKEVTGYTITGAAPNGSYVPVTDTLSFAVYQPTYSYTTIDIPLNKQLDNNFRQTISLNVNIPLFNGWQAQTAVKQAKINVQQQELNKYQAALKLKQDVYKACNEARNSIQKYYAARRAAEAAQRAFDFAQKRYDLGLTNTIEYLTTQNTLYSSESRLASAKYDLLFKLKVIDYYLGKEIKL